MSSISFPKEEEAIIQRWREIKAFETQVKLSEGRENYTFYDGPPFATGLPYVANFPSCVGKNTLSNMSRAVTMVTSSPPPSRTSFLVTGP